MKPRRCSSPRWATVTGASRSTARCKDAPGQVANGFTQPIAALPLQIFSYAISPYEDWHRQAWAAALVLILLVLGLNVGLRDLTREGRSNLTRNRAIDVIAITHSRSLTMEPPTPAAETAAPPLRRSE